MNIRYPIYEGVYRILTFGRVRRPAYGKRGIRQAHLDRPGAGTDISRAVLPNNGGEQPFLLPPAAKG